MAMGIFPNNRGTTTLSKGHVEMEKGCYLLSNSSCLIQVTCLLHWKYKTMQYFDACFCCTFLVNNGNPVEM